MTTRKVTIRMPAELYDYANAKSQAKRTSVSKEIVDIIYTHKRDEERVKADAREDFNEVLRDASRQLDGVIECMAKDSYRDTQPISFWKRIASIFKRKPVVTQPAIVAPVKFTMPENGGNVGDINEVLRGNVKSLWNAVVWDETPQGHQHWKDIQSGVKPLDDESRSYLIRLRDAVLAREKGE